MLLSLLLTLLLHALLLLLLSLLLALLLHALLLLLLSLLLTLLLHALLLRLLSLLLTRLPRLRLLHRRRPLLGTRLHARLLRCLLLGLHSRLLLQRRIFDGMRCATLLHASFRLTAWPLPESGPSRLLLRDASLLSLLRCGGCICCAIGVCGCVHAGSRRPFSPAC